jgi:protein-disulfide isomerase
VKWRIVHSLWVLWLLAGASHCALAAIPCGELSDSDKARLATYVAQKYSIPDTVKLSIKEAALISDDCHRKVTFAGQGPLGEVSLLLYLSPDLRFLSKDLMDSMLNPRQERYEKARERMTKLEDGEAPVIGDHRAPITLVVFSDFECPFCKTTEQIIRSEPLTLEGSKVRVIYRHYPLPQHPWAQKAAEISSCVEFQGPRFFWQLHDSIFQNQSEIQPEGATTAIEDMALRIEGINRAELLDCEKKELSLGVVLRDKQLGEQLGVNSTPTVFLNGEVVQFGSAAQLHDLLQAHLGLGARSEEATASGVIREF